MNSRRNSRFLALRSRNEYIPARRRVSLADFSNRRRPPTNPLAALKIRFLDRFLAAPLLERIVRFSSQATGCMLRHPYDFSLDSIGTCHGKTQSAPPGRMPSRLGLDPTATRQIDQVDVFDSPCSDALVPAATSPARSAMYRSLAASTDRGLVDCRSSKASRIRLPSAPTLSIDFLRKRRTRFPLL